MGKINRGSGIVGLFFLLLSAASVWAQNKAAPVVLANYANRDTLRLTIPEAEAMFVRKNLMLLAQQYGVDATRALILQAKLYPNPNFSFARGINQPDGEPTELAGQVQQEIVLTRKIKKQVDMARTNYALAEDNLKDVLRTLKYALRSGMYNIHYLRQIAKVYDEEINALQTVVDAYKKVEGDNYVSEAEIVQVQAQLYALQSEYQGWVDNINDQESQLRLLVQVTPSVYVVPVIDPTVVKADPLTYGVGTLLDSAHVNRTDYKIAKDNLLLSKQNYNYQKALAVPDIYLAGSYDAHGSAWPYFESMGVSFDLPVFNRNQGNIKNAQLMVKSNGAQLESTEKTVDEQVCRGLQKAIDADKLYKSIDPAFASKFDTLATKMLENYRVRNVNLLTFQSFYDSYKTNIEQLNTILYNKVNSLESLNLLTGTDFYNKQKL